jgi:hypothetical protein
MAPLIKPTRPPDFLRAGQGRALNAVAIGNRAAAILSLIAPWMEPSLPAFVAFKALAPAQLIL